MVKLARLVGKLKTRFGYGCVGNRTHVNGETLRLFFWTLNVGCSGFKGHHLPRNFDLLE